MSLLVNAMQNNHEKANLLNNRPIVPTDQVSDNPIEFIKTNTEKEESNQDNKKENSNQELILRLLKGAPGRTRSEYTYHKDVNRISIKVINEDTQEVIREIPPEKSMEILKQLMEIEGIYIDERR